MPSRKRSKGKLRQAKAAANRWQLIKWKGQACQHECPPPPPAGSHCDRFLTEFHSSMNKQAFTAKGAMQALALAHQKVPAALNEEANLILIKTLFVASGAELLRMNNSDSSSTLHGDWPRELANICQVGLKAYAGNLAGAVLVLENYDSTKDMNQVVFGLFFGASNMKNQDTIQGCERSLTRFFSKRISCSCLDKKYAAVRSLPKTGTCGNCGQRKERKSLYICVGCNAYQYCGRECHLADWCRHKPECQQIAKMKRDYEVDDSGELLCLKG